MLEASVKNNFLAVCVFCAAIFIDVASKKIITSYFVGKTLLGNFLVFGNFANNKGLFGFASLTNAVVVSVIIFVFIFFLFATQATYLQEKISLSLILGGGVENYFERIMFGRVTDIVAIGNLGVMNIADVAIFAGIVWYACILIKKYN